MNTGVWIYILPPPPSFFFFCTVAHTSFTRAHCFSLSSISLDLALDHRDVFLVCLTVLCQYSLLSTCMLAVTCFLSMRPRHVMFTPPPLARRRGLFRCWTCQNAWASSNVWVTKTTQRVYQGESCEKCGATTKPYYVGRSEESIFNRVKTPHPVKPATSSSRYGRKLRHKRFDWRVQRGRR
ncbi:hypothetical protein TRSC58_04113 [Trypanosoma rangeli SC58]|uniref:3CxxC-type domain-containing protein n=1 Tax=Trypanosoma rangeli SC58 TaxID=429131 RepID=A0A061IYG2_TRYRA|nr:hypothetical protein TRSC58_04113 [Trypanosoma rangeli SC58]